MKEYRDGSFGPIEPAKRLFKRLAHETPEDIARVHIGTREELALLRIEAVEKLLKADAR